MTVAYQAHRAAGSAAAFALDPVRIAPVRLRRRLQRRAPFLIELLNAPFRQHLPEPERQARAVPRLALGLGLTSAYCARNGNSLTISLRSGRRPYSQISNTSACCTAGARSLPYHCPSASR